MKGHVTTQETRAKISLANRGRIISPEHRMKLSKAITGKHFHSEEWKKELSKRMSGTNSPVWINDRTKLKRFGDTNKDRRSSAYVIWRKQVWLRDMFKCKLANPDCSGRLEAHHILSYTDYPKLRYDINNGITLCHAHHPRVRAEEKRLIPYFKELVSVSNDTI